MPDYTRGAILSAATTLPATAAASYMMLNNANSMVVWGLALVNVASLVITVAMITRYFINRNRLSVN